MTSPDRNDPAKTEALAEPLRTLHSAGLPPFDLPAMDAAPAIRRSLAAADTLTSHDRCFLTEQVDELAAEADMLAYELHRSVIHGDPQHGNALHFRGDTVFCDWDSAALSHSE